jgi:hypothetical protein
MLDGYCIGSLGLTLDRTVSDSRLGERYCLVSVLLLRPHA